MKLIEAMKDLKVILKKMDKNIELISEYAAVPDNERLHFLTKDSQSKEIKALIQSNTDLLKHYLKLKQQIEMTNLKTVVEINGENYTIAEMLVLKRVLAKIMVNTYGALNDKKAKQKLMAIPASVKNEKSIMIEKFYNEADKNNGQRFWDDLYHTIDSRLEVINATTELI
jgi:hypothetical protein